MVVYRKYIKGAGNTYRRRDGWFLFGFIPLYTRDLCFKGNQ